MKSGHLILSFMQVDNCQKTLMLAAVELLWISICIGIHPCAPSPGSNVSHLPETIGQDKEPSTVFTGPPSLRLESFSPRPGLTGDFAVRRMEDEDTHVVLGMTLGSALAFLVGVGVAAKEESPAEETGEASDDDAMDSASGCD